MDIPVTSTMTRVCVLGEPPSHLAELLSEQAWLEVSWLRHQQLVEAVHFAPDVILCICDEQLLSSDFDVSRIAGSTRRPVVLYGEGALAPTVEAALAWHARDLLTDADDANRILMVLRSASMLSTSSSIAACSGGHGRAKARRISVYSPKGGVGATTTATHLAAEYANQGLETLLIDLDFQFGDVAITCDVRPAESLVDFLMKSGGALDLDKVRGCLLPAPRLPRLSILAAPMRPEDAELVKEDRLRTIIDAVQYAYDVVVFDLPCQLTETALLALDCSDEVVMLSTSQAASMKNTIVAAQALDRFIPGRITHVLTGADSSRLRQLSSESAIEFTSSLSLDRSSRAAISDARFAGPRTSLGQGIALLAARLVEGTGYELTPAREPLLGRLRTWVSERRGPSWRDYYNELLEENEGNGQSGSDAWLDEDLDAAA
jgi:Flp pilus assembly CpaE family ATPase